MSMCICKPWKDRKGHKPECPCQRAYERIQQEIADDPMSDEEATTAAAALVEEGWLQSSRKYRRVIRVPKGTSAIEELEKLDPERAAKVREAAAQYLEREARSMLWHFGETRVLSLKLFEAFRKANPRW